MSVENHSSAFFIFLLDIGQLFTSDVGRAERIASMTFASIYPLYLNKVEKKGRTEDELLQVLCWLTGFTRDEVHEHIEEETTFEGLFEAATLHPNASLITGVICGYRVEEVEDSLTRKARYVDKLVDELARGKAPEKILRS